MTPAPTTGIPVRYRDRFGAEQSLLHNDGCDMSMTLRGVEFHGQFLDDFEPVGVSLEGVETRFALAGRQLCGYTLEFQLPLAVVDDQASLSAQLGVHLDLGEPTDGVIGHERLELTLEHAGRRYASAPTSAFFEDALAGLQSQLPQGVRLKCCFGCDFADYSPFGNGLFGTLYCFRNTKDKYRRVDGKAAILELWDENAGAVQETWVCNEWEPRIAGRGYRG